MNTISKNMISKMSIGFLAILMLNFTSCQKSNEPGNSNGDATVSVQIDGVSFEEDDINFEKKSSNGTSYASGIVKDTSIVYDDFVVDVVMTKDNNRSDKVVSNSTVYRGGNENMAATVKVAELTKGVKYRVVVFNADGTFNQAKDYVYGSEGSTGPMSVNAGFKYSFIAYSINSATDALPTLSYKNGVTSFANAQLLDVNKDLMVYISKDRDISHGDTKLGIIMKHKFSMITTKLTMDSKMTGSIKTLSNTTIGAVDASASYTFSTNAIAYKGNQSTYAALNFPTLLTGVGLRTVTSDPTLIINPTASNKTLKFGTITIDDETKTNFSIANIKVLPGCKYNLNLNFRTCTQQVNMADDAMNWKYQVNSTYTGCIGPNNVNYPNGTLLEKVFTAPASNYGFTFDITELDNAINMSVNGKQILLDSRLPDPTKAQVQFQTYDNTANGEGIITRNIKFPDNTEYGQDGIADIWNLKGTATAPLVRIIISKTGEVTMLGSKTSGGPLFQLLLKEGLSFQKVTWNTTGTNTIKVTQRVSNTTFVVGKGYGQAKIACPTT